MWVRFLGWEDTPATGHCQATLVFLPGGCPWTEEPGGLQSPGLQSQTRLSDSAHSTQWAVRVGRRKELLPGFLLPQLIPPVTHLFFFFFQQ